MKSMQHKAKYETIQLRNKIQNENFFRDKLLKNNDRVMQGSFGHSALGHTTSKFCVPKKSHHSRNKTDLTKTTSKGFFSGGNSLDAKNK